MRIVMHIDLDYFFAQVEEREKPWLVGKPVVVCVYSGRSQDSGAVSTANYEARRHGVHSGMPIILAKKKLEKHDGVFLPVNHPLYESVSSKVMAIIRAYADQLEQTSIDEAYVDVTRRSGGDLTRAIDLAKMIKKDIKEKERLTCSIGIGPNKLVAKIASDFQKPDGLTAVREADVKDFLSKMPVGKIPGIGRKTEAILEKMGVSTIGELSALTSESLIEIFGKKIGGYFFRASRGLDDEPVKERGEPKQFSRIGTLPEDTLESERISETLAKLAAELSAEVKARGYAFRTVGLITVLDDLSLHSRSATLDKPTDRLDDLIAHLQTLVDALLPSLSRRVRRVGVRVSGLEHAKGQRSMREYI